MLTNGFRLPISIAALTRFGLITLGVITIWFGINFVQNGPGFMQEFFIRQWELFSQPDAGHGGFPGYHFVVLLIGCFPASIFAIHAMVSNAMNNQVQKDFRKWMLILFWVILILFTIVKTKIVHYSSLAYYPLTFLAAQSLYNIVEGKWKFRSWMRFSLFFIGFIAAAVTIALPFLGRNIERLKPLFEKDPFALANLNANVNWTGMEAAAGLVMLVVIFIAVLGFNSRRKVLMFNTLFFGTAIWVFATLVFYISKIETYSQRAAIEFWEQNSDKDAYLTTYGYKSYADLYYGKVMPKETDNYQSKEWLFEGDIDKPVYISCRVTAVERIESKVEDLTFVGQKNGFYFYVRKPK